MGDKEPVNPNQPKGDRVFLEANLGNWEQLSEEQKKEVVRRIYDGAVAGLERNSRLPSKSENQVLSSDREALD